MPTETTAPEAVDPYPEHTKLLAIKDQSQAVGEFLEWLGEKGILLAEYRRMRDGSESDELAPCRHKRLELLSLHFEIDQDKLEAEKEAMLDAQRALNEKNKDA